MKPTKADQPSVCSSAPELDRQGSLDEIRDFWNKLVPYNSHDGENLLTQHLVGSIDFFEETANYKLDRAKFPPGLLDFTAYGGKRLLDVGCSMGLDLVQFAKNGAIVTGIDLAEKQIELANAHFALNGLSGDLRVMDGESLQFDDDSFDVVCSRGVLPYTRDPKRLVSEVRRVLRPGGVAIFTVFNRYSWLNLLSKFSGKNLQHEHAPIFRPYSTRQLRKTLADFAQVEVTTGRFPLRTSVYKGLGAKAYNTFFVGAFNLIPMPMARPFGAHIIAKAIK